jgi:hypothetical protein
LFKKIGTDSSNLLTTVKKTDSVYTDIAVAPNSRYEYSLEVTDSIGLHAISLPVSVYIPADERKKGIRNLNAYTTQQYKYIELNWSNNETDAKQYWIYRSSAGQPLTLVASVPANKKIYVDEEIRPNSVYKYAVKVLYKNGRSSKLAKLDVNY